MTTAGTQDIAELLNDPPRYVPRTPWGPFSALLVTALACIAPFIVFGAGIYVALWSGTTDAEMDSRMQALSSLSTPWGLAATIFSQLVSFAVIWLAAGRAGMRPEVLRFSVPPPRWAVAVAGGLVVVAVCGLLELVLFLILGYDIYAATKWLAEGMRSPLWLGTVLVAIVFAPLWEELAFRGFLLSALASTRLGFWGGALVANSMWTSLHASYGWPGMASVFTAGLIISWLVWKTGSIRSAVVAHAVSNLAAAIFAYFYVAG